MRALLPTLRPSRAARRFGVRMALFALLVAALVPSLSRLLAPGELADWAVLCQSAPASSSPAGSQDTHPGDACVLCTLAHTTPVLGAAAPAPIAVLAYAPPAPPASAPVRTRVTQARPPGARAPPLA
jgi:hypothetical protein